MSQTPAPRQEGPYVAVTITCNGCQHKKDDIINLGRGDADNQPTCLHMDRPLQRYPMYCGQDPQTPDWCPFLAGNLAAAGVHRPGPASTTTSSNTDRLRKSAMALSDLLAMIAQSDERYAAGSRPLYVWEREAFDLLAEQRRLDPETPLNAWTAERLREIQRQAIPSR